MSSRRRGRAAIVLAALVLAAAGAVGCAGPGDPGSTTHVVLLGPITSQALLERLAAGYDEGHPGVLVRTTVSPTSSLADVVRSQNESMDVIVTDDPGVLDDLHARVAGRRTLGHDAAGHTLVAAILSDSQESDVASDVVRWLTTSPAKRLLAAQGWH